jgi:N-methylhydantoinase A
MEKAIREISVERGYDPRDYTLVAFGGAGGLHACDLARALGMPRVLVPTFPGALSALGILRADVVRDYSQTVRLPVPSMSVVRSPLRRAFEALAKRGVAEMAREGFAANRLRQEHLLDMRYVGQAYELTVSASGDFVAAFHHAHERRYGYADTARAVEVVNIRVRVIGLTPKPELPRSRPGAADPRKALTGQRRAWFGGRAITAVLYRREKLRAGNVVRGPAVISEYSATTLVPPGWRARVDAYGNLVLRATK